MQDAVLFALPLFLLALNFLFVVFPSRAIAYTVNYLALLYWFDRLEYLYPFHWGKSSYLIPLFAFFVALLIPLFFSALFHRKPLQKVTKRSVQEVHKEIYDHLSENANAILTSIPDSEIQKRLQERTKWRNAIK